MIPRYENTTITGIFAYKAKLARWDAVELSVIAARVNLGLIDRKVYDVINAALLDNPCDIQWWLAREAIIRHDLNAYLEERQRYIPKNMQHAFHDGMTSYDTEEAAFALALLQSGHIVSAKLEALIECLKELARTHQHTIMLARTHGQWAKLSSFGGQILKWLAPLIHLHTVLERSLGDCYYSRLSGAIGHYGGGLTPEIEGRALNSLGLVPFYGATQILPRVVYAPLAQTLRLVAESLGQIAIDFRLGARSGTPLWHEPFGKNQTGSSAMPHKRNPISAEKVGGMVCLAQGAEQSIVRSIQTWENRAIEQSSVERVAWPDLFHVVLHILSVMHKVLAGMVVYPDNMLQEIHASRGTYASDEVRNWLAVQCSALSIPSKTAYRIVQLAAFLAFKPNAYQSRVRGKRCDNLAEADIRLAIQPPALESRLMQDIIANAELHPVDELDASSETVEHWNSLLSGIFADSEMRRRWEQLFLPSYLLKQEGYLFKKILAM